MVAPETALSASARSAKARACWVKCGPVIEGRGALRVPFDETVVVTPWDIAKGAPVGPSVLAAGRDLSTTGLSFSHTAALAARHVAVSFRGDHADREGRPEIDTLLVRLIWCRFTRRGIYLSGGRLEGTIRDGFGGALATLLGSL
jgi:hypothetical protein